VAKDHEKILFRVEQDEDGYPGVGSEGVWARPLGDGTFELDNVPFYARGVSCGDRVKAKLAQGAFWFDGVVARGGHSTLRVIAFDEKRVPEIRDSLKRLGCSTELNGNSLIAVDVPARTKLEPIVTMLRRRHAADELDYEEALLQHELSLSS
jgi:hypothetical protein